MAGVVLGYGLITLSFVLAWIIVMAIALWLGTRKWFIKRIVKWSNTMTQLLLEEEDEE